MYCLNELPHSKGVQYPYEGSNGKSIKACLCGFCKDTARLRFCDIEFDFIGCYFADTAEELSACPEMSTPQLFFQARESPEQLSRGDSLEQLECLRKGMCGVHLQEQMHVVFHDFQCKDRIPVLVCNLLKHQSASPFHMDIFKYPSPIFRHQNYMVVRLSIRMAKAFQTHLCTTCSSSQSARPAGVRAATGHLIFFYPIKFHPDPKGSGINLME